MRSIIRRVLLLGAALTLLSGALPAAADHATRPHTPNMVAFGHSPHPATFTDPADVRHINSDLAFWGDLAFNGNYDGFRIIDLSDPRNPVEISHPRCNGDQGDVVVWEDILIRTWNSPAPAGRFCDGEPVPEGFEGMHIWDISDLEDPALIGEVELSQRPLADREHQNGGIGCGSHTATAVPDQENNRLIVYNQTSIGSGACEMWPFLGIVEVPLDDPAGAHWLRDEPLADAHHSHDSGVILGDVNLLAVAGHEHSNVYSIGGPRGGSFEDPEFLYTIEEEGVCNVPGDPECNGSWHSAAFTWDGEVIILGWEPGGGAQAECEAGDPDVKKSAFFYDSETGEKLGQWTLPRPQGPDENCTIHNYNVVPKLGRYVLVSGNYQAGTWVTDFTDPANPETVAWSDPESLGPGPFCSNTSPPGCQLGGAWSTYWYNNYLYESSITEGLNVFGVRGGGVMRGAVQLDHLNPQTQEFSLMRQGRRERIRLGTSLSGDEEVPGPGDPDGSGNAQLGLFPNQEKVCWQIQWENIATPTAAHIHEGPAGVAGPIVVPLFLTAQPGNSARGCEEDVDEALIRDIAENPEEYYVNVHNSDFPGGAIRGQLGD
ncbi:MAG: CHRD domain-containing protein [Actinomycetota bacterium]